MKSKTLTPRKIRNIINHFRKIYYHINYIELILGSKKLQELRKNVKKEQIRILQDLSNQLLEKMLCSEGDISTKNLYSAILKILNNPANRSDPPNGSN